MASIAISLALSAAVTGVSALFAPRPKKPAPIDRGKLDDARFSIPALGAAIPKGWGTFRCAPIWIDHTPTLHTVQVTEGQSGGKGGSGTPPTPDERQHIYTKSVIGVFHNGPVYKGVSKMWFNDRLVYNSDLAMNEADTSAIRYEAEHGVLGGGASVANQAECSGGKKVTGLGSGGHVTINCDTTAAGSYEIGVYYTSTVDRTFKVSANGGTLNDLVCPASGGAGEVTSEVIVLSLLSGANTIKFENSGAACPDLDRIDIAPALVFTDGEDRRGFTGLIRPGAFGPEVPDYAWPMSNEAPTFSEPEGGVTNGGFYQANLADWGNPTIRFYNGSELQEADPIIVALRGIDNAPGYRGLGIVAIDNIQLQNGQMPNVTLEVQQGMREVPAIVTDIYREVGVDASLLDLTALQGLLLGDASGFDPGTYGAITWTGLVNATQTGGGAITKTSGTTGFWNAYANSGDSVSSGTDASIRFTAGSAGTYMIGFCYTTTPGQTLPNPYDQTPFAVVLNKNSNPSQELKNTIQLSLGGTNNSFDVGTWSPGDKFQVEYRNGRFAAYQNGLMLTGYTPPVPSTFPLRPIWIGYATGGGPSAASFAAGSNIGTEPIVSNGGGLYMESPTAAAEMIQALMVRFQFSLPEVDGKVKAVLNNATSDLAISYTELRAHRGDSRPSEDMVITRVDPLALSKRTTVTYSDPALSYHTRTQSEIRLFGPQQGSNDLTLPMIETAQNMKNLAITLSNREEVEGQTYRFTLGPKYMRIHQGTVLTINSRSAVTHTVRVKEVGLELPAGIVDVEAVRQDASVFSASGTPSDLGTEPPIVPVPGNTAYAFIDGPLVEPESDGDQVLPILYVTLSGRGSGGWTGAFMFREFPANSDNYQLLDISQSPSRIGVASTQLLTVDDTSILDELSFLSVSFYIDAALESVTEAELIANPKLNLIAVVNPDGDVEYVQFKTAVLQIAEAPYLSKYVLSGFRRGLYDTDINVSTHTSTDTVVVMDATIRPIPMSVSEIGLSRDYKFPSVGQAPDSVPAVSFAWAGNAMKAHAVTDIRVVMDASNDVAIEFVGHQRTAEEPAQFVVEIWSSTDRSNPANLKRTLPVTTGTTQAALLVTATPTDVEGPKVAHIITSTHTDKNNLLGTAGGISGATLQIFDGNYMRLDFTLIGTTAGATPQFAGLIEDGGTGVTGGDPADMPCNILVTDGGGGTADIDIRNYTTVVHNINVPDATLAAGMRFTILITGNEYRVYQDYSFGKPALVVITTPSTGPTFPLRGYFEVADVNDLDVRDIIVGTGPVLKTIYSEREQLEDFTTLPPTIFGRVYQRGLSPIPNGWPVDFVAQTMGGHLLQEIGDDILLEDGTSFLLKE